MNRLLTASDKKKRYKLPLFLSVFLHLLLLVFLLSSIFFYHPHTYQQQAIQANLISNAQFAKLMTKSSPPINQKMTAVIPTPPKVISEDNNTPVKNKAIAAPTPQITKAPSVLLPIPKKITTTKPIAVKPKLPTPSTQQQSLLEDSLLQEELAKNQKPTKTTQPSTTKQEQLMMQQLTAETQNHSAATAAFSQATKGEIDQYKTLILQQIEQNWIVPQNVDQLSCVLQISVAPGGTVLQVTVVKPSGNEALDRSALAAVNKSSPLPVPKDSAAFSAFRNFHLTVTPKGSSFE